MRRLIACVCVLSAVAALASCRDVEKTEPIQLKKREKSKWPTPMVALAGAPAVANPLLAPPPSEYVKTLVFEDSFDRAAFGDKWRLQGGDWRIEGGAVVTRGARNKCLWGTWELPAEAEIEFDAKSDFDDGDIKFSIYSDGENYEGGYILIFGGWKNSVSLIARLDEHAIQKKLFDLVRYRSDVKVQKGRVYKYKVVRKRGLVEWFIDGESFLKFDDADPFFGPGHDRFAFCNWESPLTFDNLKVFALKPKPAEPGQSPATPAPAPVAPKGAPVPARAPTKG